MLISIFLYKEIKKMGMDSSGGIRRSPSSPSSPSCFDSLKPEFLSNQIDHIPNQEKVSMKLTIKETTEAELLASVIEYLRSLVETRQIAFFERRNSGKSFAADGRYAGAYYRAYFKNGECYERGMPDIDGVLKNGRYFAIELKSRRGILSKEQTEISEKFISLNVAYTVAYSLNDVILFLNKTITE